MFTEGFVILLGNQLKRKHRKNSGVYIRRRRTMRLDKYLKVSRIIKRRTVANEACDSGRVMLNDKWQEPVQRLRWGM